MTINPMQSAHSAPRCTAKSKRTQSRCKNPAVRNWYVCRMHGAGGGAPAGKRNGNFRHGASTTAMTEQVWQISELMRASKEITKLIELGDPGD